MSSSSLRTSVKAVLSQKRRQLAVKLVGCCSEGCKVIDKRTVHEHQPPFFTEEFAQMKCSNRFITPCCVFIYWSNCRDLWNRKKSLEVNMGAQGRTKRTHITFDFALHLKQRRTRSCTTIARVSFDKQRTSSSSVLLGYIQSAKSRVSEKLLTMDFG